MGSRTSPHPMLPDWAVLSPERLRHVERVVHLVRGWADRMGTQPSEAQRWVRAAWLHDALRDAPDHELVRLAPDAPGPPSLRHGAASAALAERDGETDRGVLDAVRYHSLGWPDWDQVGVVLYCADFLEPGREYDREARADLARRFPGEPEAVLFEVARRRLAHLVRTGWSILEPTWRFWNRLARDRSAGR